MNSIDLTFFAAVADAGGIGRAAGVLNTVQSNVTGRIRALEQALGTPLFYRGSRGVTLTSAGERLLPYARQVAGLLADAKQAVLSEAELCGPLRLGSMETTAALRLPRLLIEYANLVPEVDITLETGPTEALIAAVLDRRIEGAFVSGPVTHGSLCAVPILEEELVLVASLRLQSFDAVVAALSGPREGRVLVFKPGCSYRLRLEAFLAAQGLVHVRRMEFGTLDGIIGCIEAGMGVSMLPRVVAEAARAAGRVSIHPVLGAAGGAETLLTYRKDNLLTAAFERFLELALKIFGSPSAADAPIPSILGAPGTPGQGNEAVR